jgi:hypothetical protein
MSSYRYRAFYSLDGSSNAVALRSQKSDEDVGLALEQFASGLPHYLGDNEAGVEIVPGTRTPSSVEVVVHTSDNHEYVTDAVKQFLDSLGLYGRKL